MNKEYLTFRELESKGKTKIFSVVTLKDQEDVLGLIKWDSGWRQYIFSIDVNTIWSNGCLGQIKEFIDKLMEERK
jgi:hypothetical protein